ncbi:hypothetical protein OAK17_06740 [Alphaproteobacteria bacterium]|nr:hypothetical protein [Alphaproteobacteria bacterium]
MITSLQNNNLKLQINLQKKALKNYDNQINFLLTQKNDPTEKITKRIPLKQQDKLNIKSYRFDQIQSCQFLTQIIAQNHFYCPKKIYLKMVKNYQKNVEYSQNFLFQNKQSCILI